jgi:5-methylcytosine-specific restriction endonuclease McrA
VGSTPTISAMSYKDINKQKNYQRICRAKRRIQEKEIAFNKLGGKCSECGIDDFRVLQIDHIIVIRRNKSHGFIECGSVLKQKIANGSYSIKNLQLLCANCHQIKTYNDLFVK